MENKFIDHCPVITINREYGAAGRSLAALLSERLGIPYYDRDFVKKTAQVSGFDVTDVEEEGEELSRSAMMLDSFLDSTVSYSSSHDAIYKAEKEVVLTLSKSPCIIVGRSADHILKEAGMDVFRIYLHAPLSKRLERAAELSENGNMKLEKYVEKRDARRRIFYKKYTGHEMSDASNYELCLDVGRIPLQMCADMIIEILKNGQDS